ncbi:alpha/beta fold hydrolase [Microbacterium marinilacus]|uniref:Alpha/beta hydrolase n=1 Tax=Microbacterium marinilacus TaxID=415209 RepID=A0ABP7BPM6_9MICO|nr:alpha/beta hydrolase [Microbacterium marinilacus]MBY0690381.1 alpha/beta hydrolase [Microbacterium marinilacus]
MSNAPSRWISRRARSAAAVIAALSLGALTGIPIGAGLADAPTASGAVEATSDRHDAATRDDAAFNRQFEHKFATVDDVRMHYVTGGEGPPLVLIHGWPQTWFEWRDIMPALAEHRTVYAIDLPGLGDSYGSPRSFDKKTLAQYVHGLLVDELGLDAVDLVAHDLGAGVGFQYATQFPDAVTSYIHMDYPLPSSVALPAAQYRTFSWHMSFNSQPALPEQLVDDRQDVREYLEEFYTQVAFGGAAFGGDRSTPPFTSATIDEFTRTYSRPDVLSNGFELYRTLEQDQLDNDGVTVSVPTKLVTATGSLASAEHTITPLFDDLREAVEIPDSGHWLPEENPEAVIHEILSFILD